MTAQLAAAVIGACSLGCARVRPMSADIEEGDHGEGPAVVVAGRVVARGGT